MKTVVLKLKKLIKRVKSFFPTPLPIGVTEFHSWAEDIMELSGSPSNDSVKFGLASMIMHAPSTAAFKSKHYFVLLLRKSMANQVGAGMMQELKARQQEALEAARKELEAKNVTEVLPS